MMALGYCTVFTGDTECTARALRGTTACRAHADRDELLRSRDEAEGLLAELVRGSTLRSPCIWCAHPDDRNDGGFQHTSSCLVWKAAP